jgi:membrane-bound lytic murein transglycosylase MltF
MPAQFTGINIDQLEGSGMRTFIIACIVLVLATLSGCRPLSEDVAKRTTEQTPEEKAKIERVFAKEEERMYALVDPMTESVLRSYGRTMRGYAERYNLDWRLILAVMKTESGFSPDAVSCRGALGLMQIMPVTAEHLARTLDLRDVVEPINNIHGGVYYLRQLYDMFSDATGRDRIELALAAYNAGIGRVYDAQALVTFFHGNPNKWDFVRQALPMLSRAYCELHEIVWDQDHPKTGWFNNSQETLTYVDRIMTYYSNYCVALN